MEAISEDLLDLDVTLIALGTGEARYETFFRKLAEERPWQVRVKLVYDNRLAHAVEAGSDIFLMPSQYEPCGLNQIYSLRYGTPPVVRATGGLDDTIEEETGFKFQEYSGSALLAAIRQALKELEDKPNWRVRMRRGMLKDFSWNTSAREYSALYGQLLSR
jgi:starch synthase